MQRKLPYTDLAIGIDMGLKHFMTDSNGDVVDNPRFFQEVTWQTQEKAATALKKEKQEPSPQKFSSACWERLTRRFATSAETSIIRKSRILVDTFETIVFEDLSMHHMVKRPKAKQDENGKYLPNGAAAKGGLNKSILDAGWASFIELVKHKAEWAGVTVMKWTQAKPARSAAPVTRKVSTKISVYGHMSVNTVGLCWTGIKMLRLVRRFGACQISPTGRWGREQRTPRTPNQLGEETQRGKQHVGKADKQEGMYCDAPQVLCVW